LISGYSSQAMAEIQKLPDNIANQIAAGEVVQRPASIVKELLENAIDSGADRIELRLKAGGIALVSVLDNGSGIDPDELALAFERHATSKLRSADDLFNLSTKGFRGEALASIAAVADVHMVSKREGVTTAFQIKFKGGKSEGIEETAFSKGTSVSVNHLFYSIPARKNFLKSESVELKHCLDEFQRVALLHEEIHFQCHHNDAVVYDLPTSTRRQRIVHLFGTKYAERLVPIEEKTERFVVSGFILKPEHARKTRGEQFFFVNKRFVRSPYLHRAVVEAFEGLLLSGYHPGYFIEIEIDKSAIDVNIHPTKTEIKIDDEYHVFSVLRAAIRHSLGRYQINAPIDFDLNPSLNPSYKQSISEAKFPKISVSSSFNPFQNEAVKTTDFSEVYIETEAEQIRLTPQIDHQEALLQLDGIVPIQWDLKFIVVPQGEKLLVVDQYRAHHRILYEFLLKKMTVDQAGSQQLLFPEIVSLDAHEMELLNEIGSTLIDLGFDYELQEREVVLKGVPEFFPVNEASKVFKHFIEETQLAEDKVALSTADLVAQVLAKHSAIKKGVFLNQEAMTHLLEELARCKEPYISPSNKRFFVSISVGDIIQKLH